MPRRESPQGRSRARAIQRSRDLGLRGDRAGVPVFHQLGNSAPVSALVNADLARDAAILGACDLLSDISASLKSLRDQRDTLNSQRQFPAAYIFATIGQEMLDRGQKSRRVGGYIIEVGMEAQAMCACHGALLGDCDSIGPIEVLPARARPFVRIRRNKDAD